MHLRATIRGVNHPCSNCGDAIEDPDRERCQKCSPGRPPGLALRESPGWSKINIDEALQLRADDPKAWSNAKLGAKYGVSKQAVDRALRVYAKRRAGEAAKFREVTPCSA